jgi:hypothetical protein
VHTSGAIPHTERTLARNSLPGPHGRRPIRILERMPMSAPAGVIERLHSQPPPSGVVDSPAQPVPPVRHLRNQTDHTTSRPEVNEASPRAAASPAGGTSVRSWPLLVLALPAAIAVWSGWVGIGTMTGFGQVHPLPGIWDTLHLNTAVTLPVGVEAYAAYALRAWLSPAPYLARRTRAFARWSAIGSLLLGMAGQVAYHLLAQTHTTHAPWAITTAVSCLPVLVLGMGAALAHLLRADTHAALQAIGQHPNGDSPAEDTTVRVPPPHRITEARAAAARLRAAGQRISRRSLRDYGIRGSNADLGTLARLANAPDPSTPDRERP